LSEPGKKLTDASVEVPKRICDGIPPGIVKDVERAKRFDNPRGYPGLAGFQLKRPADDRTVEHNISDKDVGFK
jgi:hypothetical protein